MNEHAIPLGRSSAVVQLVPQLGKKHLFRQVGEEEREGAMESGRNGATRHVFEV